MKENTGGKDENSINNALEEQLFLNRDEWELASEINPGEKGVGKPDIEIKKGSFYMIVETEIGSKSDPDKDAINRLSKGEIDSKKKLAELVMAIKIPEKYRNYSGKKLRGELRKANDFEYSIHSWDGKYQKRFPESGFLTGGILEIELVAQTGIVTSANIKKNQAMVINSIKKGAKIISELNEKRKESIGRELAQDTCEQTWRMTVFILFNAIMFHDHAAEALGLKTRRELTENGGRTININDLHETWHDILEEDYYPIFNTARNLLKIIGDEKINQFLPLLFKTASNLEITGLGNYADVYGEVFQDTISDSDELAANYTRPILAAMLATLTLPSRNEKIWDNPTTLRVADFACGTGSLLLAAYRTIIARYEINNPKKKMTDLHGEMLEKCIIGGDVLPMATNITASSLANMYPGVSFKNTRIYLEKLGGKNDSVGTLEWLANQSTLDSDSIKISAGGDSVDYTTQKNATYNVILMNPPYTRAKGTGGNNEEKQTLLFQSFGITSEQGSKMLKRAKNLVNMKNGCSNAIAGLPTFFMDMIHKKIDKGGRVGLVLPNTVSNSPNFKKFRRLLSLYYSDFIIVNILGDSSMSGNTNMGELMISMKRNELEYDKYNKDEEPTEPNRGIFITLTTQPTAIIESIEIARSMRNEKLEPILMENGIKGGTKLKLGEKSIGSIQSVLMTSEPWISVGIKDFSLIQRIRKLCDKSILTFPNKNKSYEIPMKDAFFGNDPTGTGPLDILANFPKDGEQTKFYRGPFIKNNYEETCIYPMIWSNDGKTQLTLLINPDTEATPTQKSTDLEVDNVWNKRSRVHYNIDLSINSQQLSACMTADETIGGNAWPTVNLPEKYEKAFVIWQNTTMGIACRFAYASKSQPKRLRVSRTQFPKIPIIDFDQLSDDQIEMFDTIFDVCSSLQLKSISKITTDSIRISMDDGVCSIFDVDTDHMKILRDDLSRELNN